MGPNISVLKGKYSDFWDHHVPLSDLSLCELLELRNLSTIESHSKFLPYNMVRVKSTHYYLFPYILIFLFMEIFGKQFLIIAKKVDSNKIKYSIFLSLSLVASVVFTYNYFLYTNEYPPEVTKDYPNTM